MFAGNNHQAMTSMPAPRQLGPIKVLLFLLCLIPAVHLCWLAWSGNLGTEPVEFVQRRTGFWTLNLLLLTLCVTPLRAMTQLHWLLRLRRMLGLFCFFYALLHLLSFIGLDHAFSLDAIARDIVKRPFVSAGLAALLLLVPLALTSNQWAIRRLGGRKWQELHRNIYLAGILAIIHYFWLTKLSAFYWPLAYGIALAVLLGWRIHERRRKAIPAPRFTETKPLKFFKQKPD